ncbi:3-beta hydroxysteroid dehydrogenase/isomerase [Corchorus capsularis]|uniref:3-beta hydroxysteroid dehydrogenase/isomerase n=1 Tax=Corchorus capsularis TaxID=210143 RepID=A0A1R3HI16_COCAP|nr:3-beta hydroxysteroid dehydrogenase/isomerase [Corchorus capsularis]
MEKANCKVCVTGGAGFVGSSLVKKLLEKGYTVHATLTDVGDLSKAELLKSLPGADTRLVLFQANMYQPEEFEQAIQGCTCVFHVANPLYHIGGTSQTIIEVSVSAMKSIVMSCLKSGSVRRLIYTATVSAASPLKEDGSGFKDLMDETCWTSLNLKYPYFHEDYVESKTITEKEFLRYCSDAKTSGKLEMVSLASGVIAGDTILPYAPATVGVNFVAENLGYGELASPPIQQNKLLTCGESFQSYGEVVSAHYGTSNGIFQTLITMEPEEKE